MSQYSGEMRTSLRGVLLTLVCCAGMQVLHGQTLKKYPIEKSGCQVYMYCNPGKFEVSLSPDSSKVYAGECKLGEDIYDVICVRMKERISNPDDAEQVLLQYLEYLRTSFQVTETTGYGKGHRLRANERTRGIIDYWKDEEGMNIKVKGWTDGAFIAVNLVVSPKTIDDAKVNPFLDGIVFPEAKKVATAPAGSRQTPSKQ